MTNTPDPVTAADLAEALREAIATIYELDVLSGQDTLMRPNPDPYTIAEAAQALIDRYDAQCQQAVTAPAIDTDRNDVMLCAARYAMPRQTYMGSTVRRYVHAHLHEWPKVERDRLAIAIDQAADATGQLGDEVVDRPGWLALRDALRGGE